MHAPTRSLHTFPPLPYLSLSNSANHYRFRSPKQMTLLVPFPSTACSDKLHSRMSSEVGVASLSHFPTLPPAGLKASSSSPSLLLQCRVRRRAVRGSLGATRLGFARVRIAPLLPRAASDQPGQVQEDEVVDSNVLPYCSLDRKQKKSVGEMEQEFLQALQSFYYDKKAIMSNEEFDVLKEELMWEGSSVVMLILDEGAISSLRCAPPNKIFLVIPNAPLDDLYRSKKGKGQVFEELGKDEQMFLEASMAYVAGKPLMTDEEFDNLKLRLKLEGSDIVQEGPRCSLRSRKVYSDLTVDYFKMFLLNVPAAVVALGLFFFLDDLTGFEITYLLELPEPFSFIFTWFAAVPLIFWLAQAFTSAVLRDFLILKGPCPNCGTENLSFFGTILSIPSGGKTNAVKCSNCGTSMVYDAKIRLITLSEGGDA